MLSAASPLLLGLPFALFTQSMHYVPQSLLRECSVPVNITLQKYYFLPEIQSLQERADEARTLGSAAAEEWLKGLSTTVEVTNNDVNRFEQWDLNGGLVSARLALSDSSKDNRTLKKVPLIASGLPPRPSSITSNPPSFTPYLHMTSSLPPMPSHGFAPGVEPFGRPHVAEQSDSRSMSSQQSTGTNKASKTSRERARIRAYKKADIVDRCRKLNPPISKDMLERLEAFDAALKVPMPLNENSWETLRDRLIVQSHKAVLEDEARNATRTAPVPGLFRPPSRTDEYVLAHTDTPRKEKLCQIAEEFIKQKWGHGGWVTYPTAPQFAAEVLIHTRRTYLDEQARVASLQASSGYMTLSTPQEDNLKLEDMKWVFQQTINPRTEQIRKDLFVCPICPTASTVKYFAFESIIQHYASKHTTAFSNGPQKVTWKAEWPETPPFSVHPERIHTPPPSITHTPTLSHRPLSTMSPGSIKTSTDSMSIFSDATNTYSTSGHGTQLKTLVSTAPGVGMYEVQRDDLSSGLVRGWQMLPTDLHIPPNLQLYLAIAFAISTFGKKYSNPVSLELFRDCLNTKAELRNLKDIESLKCAECMASGRPEARANWALLDLIAHFKEAHIDQNQTGTKLSWETEMVAIPEPALIRSLQSDRALPNSMRELLEGAAQTSAIQFTQINIPVLDPRTSNRGVPNSYDASDHMNLLSTPSRYQQTYAVGYSREDEIHYHQHPSYRKVISSVAATYGDRSIAADSFSTSSKTVQGDEVREVWVHQRPMLQSHVRLRSHDRVSMPEQLSSSIEATQSATDGDLDMMRGEAMTRSNTVRSYHSRNEQHVTSAADDFLSTIESHVDVEMADSGLLPPHAARTSRPASRTSNDTVTKHGVIQKAPDYTTAQSLPPSTVYYEREAPQTRQDRQYEVGRGPSERIPLQVYDAGDDRGERMEREPSRVIEFNHDGTPIAHEGRAYHETSPPRRIIARHYVDQYDRPLQQMPPTQHRSFQHQTRDMLPERLEYAGSRESFQPMYQSIDYIPSRTYREAYNYDLSRGQYYAHDHSPTRRYVEVSERDSRIQTLYDAQGRPVQFREVDPSRYAPSTEAYERYEDSHEDRRYAGR